METTLNPALKTLAVITTFLLCGAIAADAETAPETEHIQMKKVETPVPVFTNTIAAAFSPQLNSQQVSSPTYYGAIADDLREDGTRFGWIDEDGTPLVLTRENDEILVQRENGPTSKLKLTDMSGVIEPQIGISAVSRAK